MRVDIYVFFKRSTLIDPKIMHPIDEHLIRAMHVESIYDVLHRIGSVALSELEKKGFPEVVEKLKKYYEAVVEGEKAINILRDLLGLKDKEIRYLVLRLVKT